MTKEDLIEPGKKSVTYTSYLRVNELLNLQTTLSDPPQHDEMLFIIIHQVYELWFKQILHEVGRAEQALINRQIISYLKTLQRVLTIQKILVHQVDVLETMTPVEFNSFRERLNPASGFQSLQFRLLEFKLGLKNRDYIRFHRNDPKAVQTLEDYMKLPTLYDQFLKILAADGFAIPEEILKRDVSEPYKPNEQVTQELYRIYKNHDQHHDLYAALEAMIDIDQGLLIWRHRHVAMVERMIGSLKGTGGSSGVRYLSSTLEKRCFPEIWLVRNLLGTSNY